MTLTRFFSFIFLAITATLVWWLEDVVQTAQIETLRKEHNRPDFYMQDFVMRNYDTGGSLRYTARGESLLRYPKDDNLEIKQLDMLSFRKDKAPLSVKSDSASLTDSGNQVHLTGNVRIDQDKTATEDSLSIRSEKLFIDNNRDYMETNTPILIQTSKHKLEGTGMQAWMEYKKYRLLTKVRGKHEP